MSVANFVEVGWRVDHALRCTLFPLYVNMMVPIGTNARDGLGCLKKQRFAQETIPTKPSGVCNNDKKKICGSTSSERSEV